MKIVVISIAGTMFLSLTFQGRNDTGLLLEKNWNIYKAVEVIDGDTTVSSRNNLRAVNSLGGKIRFTTDSTGTFYKLQDESFTWKKMGLDRIEITIDNQINKTYNKHFFGPMKIVKLNDSTLVLNKNVSRNGSWTRTFYLELE